jgi:hypothetical protein
MMRKHNNHIYIYRYEMKHKTTTNHNTNVITEFENLAYVFGPFVLEGEAFLFMFKYLKCQHSSAKRLQN